jgi:hypothetical protein
LPETNKSAVEGARREWLLLFPLIMAMAVALLSGCAAQSSQPSGQNPQAEQPSGSGGGQGASRSELGPPVLGDAGAPVLMVEYGDFQ